MTTGNLTIQDNDTVVQYELTGTYVFEAPFPILENDELKVSIDQVLLTYGTHYTIAGLGDDGGVEITLTSAGEDLADAGDLITLWQDMPIERLTGFSTGAAVLLPEALNAEFAARLRVEQQLRREIRNSIRLAPDDPVGDQQMLLPTTDRVGKFLVFGSDGRPSYASGTGTDDGLRTDLAAGEPGLVSSISISYAQSPAELAAVVDPATANKQYEWGDPRRYTTLANQAAVLAHVTNLAYYTGWYRGDRAQHIQATNCIVGLGAYNDLQMTGTLGYRCTAFGALALSQNQNSTLAGGSNTAVGYGAQQDSVDTSGNTSVGTKTLASCTGVSSAHNGAFGNSTLEALVDGTQNNAFAYRALYQLVTGNNNTAMGDVCQQGLLVGSGNTDYGYQAGHSKLAGDNTHAFGYQALFNEQSAVVTAISKAASAVVTISTVSSINPFSVGQPVRLIAVAGMTEINGVLGFVTAIGGSSGAWTVAVGVNSTAFTTYTSGGYLTPQGNTVFGYRGGFNVSMRGGCTLIGYDAGQTGEPGYGCTFMGFQAGLTVNANAGGDGGELNTLMGFWSGRLMTSGASNSNYGNRSGENVTTGSENTCLGSNAGAGVTSADQNTWCGTGSAVNLNGNLNSGLGYNAGVQGSAQTYSNVTCLGANSTVTGSNQLQLGGAGTTSYSFGAVQDRSDLRDKTDVRDTALGLAFINGLRAVDFRWDMRSEYEEGIRDGSKARKRFHHGLIAQEVKRVSDELGVDFGGYQDHAIAGGQDVLSLGYTEFVAPLIKAVQELSAQVQDLQRRLEKAEQAGHR